MHRLFGWIVAAGVLLGSASAANAQISFAAGHVYTGTGIADGGAGSGYAYYGASTYGVPNANALGFSTAPGLPLTGTTYNAGFTGYGPPNGFYGNGTFAMYPLRTLYPYSYTGPGNGFGNYSYNPYPYAPVGYGWYGQFWRGW